MTTFVVGDVATVSNTFSALGVLTDPTTVSLAVTNPAGTTTTYTYAAAQITRVSLGYFTKDITLDTAGTWSYVWTGTGAAADVADGVISVWPHLAPPATAILTFEEAKDAINVRGTSFDDGTIDRELAQLVGAASNFVDGIDGPVVQRTITDERHVGGRGLIVLHHRPVVSITTINEYASGTATLLTAETETVAGTYRVDLATGIVYRRSSWSDYSFGAQSVVVTYVAGRYTHAGTVAPIYKEAAVAALMHFWQHRGAQSGAGAFGGDGAPFSGVPFSTDTLRKKLAAMLVPYTPVIA